MAASGLAARGAVIYNRAALDAGAGSGPAPQPQAIAAVRLGWALEELVARVRMVQPPQVAVPGLEFPPDLTHQLTPAGQIRILQKLLMRQETLLLSPDAAPATPLPMEALGVSNRLTEFIGGVEPSGPTAAMLGPLDTLVHDWDERIVEYLLDPTWPNAPISAAMVSAYEVGKALSRTRWYIWAEANADKLPGAAVPSGGASAARHTGPSAAWALMFDGSRVGQIRRQLDGLGGFLDTRTVTTVSNSLEYWHNALHNLDRIIHAGTSAPRDSSGTGPSAATPASSGRQRTYASWPRGMAAGSQNDIQVTRDESPALLAALEEQMDNWYDLLTGRRAPDAFPITGIITQLLDELGRQVLRQAQGLGARLLRGTLLPLAPAVVVILLLVAAVTLILIVIGGPGNADPVARGAAGVGAGLTGLVALLAARGSALLGQGTTALGDLQQRISRLEGQVQERLTALEATAPPPAQQAISTIVASAPAFSWQKVWQDAMADVVDQLKIEELNLAVSEPLVRYVLAPQGEQVADDPMLAVRRFLELVYGGSRSNVERLEAVFTNLYGQIVTSATPPSAGLTPSYGEATMGST